MVEAGDLETGCDPRQTMAPDDGFLDGEVTGEDQCGPMEIFIVRHGGEGLEPYGLMGNIPALDREIDGPGNVTDIERALVGPGPCHRMVEVFQHFRGGGKGFGVGDIRRHVDLMVEPLIRILKRGDHRQDGHAVLIRLCPSGRK